MRLPKSGRIFLSDRLLVCSEESECPTVNISHSVGAECDDSSRRTVTMAAEVRFATARPLSARLTHGGTVLDTATTTSGTATLNHSAPYAPGIYTFVVEIIEPRDCVAETVTVTVEPCLGEDCPTLEDITTTISEDCVDGEREVTVSANVTPGSTSPVFVQWYHNTDVDTPERTLSVPGTAASVSTPGTPVSSSYAYPASGARHTATLTILHPLGCEATELTVGPLEPCPSPPPTLSTCPNITSFEAIVGEGCAGEGSHHVTVEFQAEITSPLDGCVVTYVWDFGDGSQVETEVPTTTHPYDNSGDYPASVVIKCGERFCDVENTTVEIPPCCPTVTVSASTPEGCADGRDRPSNVELVAVTNPPAARGTFTWDFGDGAGPNPGSRSEAHPYTQPGEKTVRVTFTPTDMSCASTSDSTTISIPACSTSPPPSPDNSCRDIICAILLGGALVLLTLAVILGFIAGCAWPNTFTYPMIIVFVASVVAWALALALLAIWGALCGSFNCDAVTWLIGILSVLTGIAGIVAAILGAVGNPCWIGSLIGSGYLGTALAVAIAIGAATGCYGPRSGD